MTFMEEESGSRRMGQAQTSELAERFVSRPTILDLPKPDKYRAE